MIKVDRTPKPERLTSIEQQKLTMEFKIEKKRVWNKPYIKEALIEMSNRKCVYCEAKIGEEAKYMEVEHYLPKEEYPDKVIEWGNLFPSCKRCNGKKGIYDPSCNPFIHPTNDTPKHHLILQEAGRVSGVDEKGHASVKILDLNHYDTIRKPRLRIIHDIRSRFVNLLDEMKSRSVKENPVFQRKIQRMVRAILLEATPKAAYSAYVACEVLNHPSFYEIIERMKDEKIWNVELERLFQQAKHYAFTKRT